MYGMESNGAWMYEIHGSKDLVTFKNGKIKEVWYEGSGSR